MTSIQSRRLVPAPSPGANEFATSLQISNTPAVKSGVKRASTACQKCKSIKRKCDQQLPCSNCVRAGTTCLYDQTQDGRRRAARKRNVEELELKRDALDTILDALRNSDDKHVHHLLHLIRTNKPLEEIIRYATAHDGSSDADQITSPTLTVDTGFSRKSVLSISALCDSPPLDLHAKPWTEVTSDDNFVSHLMSAYFSWYHPAYPCLDRDVFLAEMQSKNLEGSFCSPLLVNAMLAVACQFSDHPLACQTPGDPSTRGLHFLKEAMRLWENEAGRPKLTNIQASQAMAVTLTVTGKDRLSFSYVDQLNDMSADMLCKLQRMHDDALTVALLQKSMRSALWSAYLLSVGYGLAFMRTRAYSRPAIDRPDSDEDVVEWIPYPSCEPRLRIPLSTYSNLQFDLHEAGAEIANFVFTKCGTLTDLRLGMQTSEEKLYLLLQSLPPSDQHTTVVPQILDLHLVYHWLRLNLFNFIQTSSSSFPDNMEDLHSYGREQCLTSAQQISSLYRRWFYDFGSGNLTMWMPQTALLAAHVLIEHLDKVEVHDLFHDVCLVITSISRRWFVMRGHARMLLITAEQKGQLIPERTRQLLRFVARDTWKPDDHKHFDRSAYPNYALAKKDGPRGVAMGDLLEQWANLELNSGDECQESVSTTSSKKTNDNLSPS